MRNAQPSRLVQTLAKLVTPSKIVAVGLATLSLSLGQTTADNNLGITRVEGESWLNHLNRTIGNSAMGRSWSLGPPPGQKADGWRPRLSPAFADRPVTLHGSDLYRFNCRECHQETGQGVGREIKPLISPVRATSVELIMTQMKARGMELSRADAMLLAQQANTGLIQRLHKGGKNMPPLPQLRDPEIRSLFAYLRELAGVPGAEKQQVTYIEPTSFHIGELIVKSTCHICHNAAGENPTPQQLFDGMIPPLSSLTTRTGLPAFVRKVTKGAPIVMGTPKEEYRGRMPVFYYLTDDEVTSAYLYLSFYPPQS